jgi:hypothetical protein
MVYNKMNCISEYSADCFSDLHNKIRDDYKDILKTITETTENSGLLSRAESKLLQGRIENSTKVVQRKDSKPRIRQSR